MTNEKLQNSVARAVLRAPDVHPKTGKVHSHEVVFTIRPGWSRFGEYLPALPGGKIDSADLKGIVAPETIDDPRLVLTLDQCIQAGLNTVERELLEELGLIVPQALLSFVDVSTNRAGWTTYAYAADLPEKPTLLVKPESAGTRWIDVLKILMGHPTLLQGHLSIARRGIRKLGGYSLT